MASTKIFCNIYKERQLKKTINNQNHSGMTRVKLQVYNQSQKKKILMHVTISHPCIITDNLISHNHH